MGMELSYAPSLESALESERLRRERAERDLMEAQRAAIARILERAKEKEAVEVAPAPKPSTTTEKLTLLKDKLKARIELALATSDSPLAAVITAGEAIELINAMLSAIREVADLGGCDNHWEGSYSHPAVGMSAMTASPGPTYYTAMPVDPMTVWKTTE